METVYDGMTLDDMWYSYGDAAIVCNTDHMIELRLAIEQRAYENLTFKHENATRS